MRPFLLLTLLLLAPCQANSLSLEFAQEGEPSIPRALIVIHNTFEDRSALESFFQAWSTRSWGRDQYCSVYSYQYDGSGLQNLTPPEILAKDLYSRIRSDSFKTGRPDPVNPARRTDPGDPRQPRASFKGKNLELLFAGHGYGGLVARETTLLAKKDGLKVTRVAYVGSPLDGLSTIDLILAFGVRERALEIGLPQELRFADFAGLSQAWWRLVDLADRYSDWGRYFAPANQEVLSFGAHGSTPLASHPSQNVLYGRHRQIARNDQGNDGFLPQPATWGKTTGPTPWVSETALKGTSHSRLSKESGEFLIKELVDRQMTFSYLTRRQGIEDYFRGDGELPPLGVYWDERDLSGMQPMWRNAYARPKDLYEMMWGVSP